MSNLFKKKLWLFLPLCFILALVSFQPMSASAVNAFYAPIYGLTLVDRSDDFSVLSETLTLAPPAVLSDSLYVPNMPNVLNTRYEIENKGAAKTCRVALPVIERFSSDFAEYKLSANGVSIPPRAYYTDVSPFSFRDFDNLLSYAFADAVVYDDSLSGVLYEITAPSAVEVSFTLAANQKIIHSANSSRITSGVQILTNGTLGGTNGRLSIFVIGGELDYSCENPDAVVTSSIVSYNDFLANFAEIELALGDGLPYSVFASNAFEKFISGFVDVLGFNDLFPRSSGLVFLVYDLEFLAGVNVVITERPVDYTSSYSTEPPQYALHFVNAPYRSWVSFGSTNISVTTPPDLSYILSEGFTQTAPNSYSFSGDLVSADEYFVTYCSAKNPVAPTAPSWWTPLRIVCIAVSGVAFVGLLVSVFFLVRGLRRRV